MKQGKAEGIDDESVEMLKALDEKATGKMVQICQQITTSGEWPVDFRLFRSLSQVGRAVLLIFCMGFINKLFSL